MESCKLSEEQTRRLLQAVVFPDVAQAAPLMMPEPIARQLAAHILDAVEGRKQYVEEEHRWERSVDASPAMHLTGDDDA